MKLRIDKAKLAFPVLATPKADKNGNLKFSAAFLLSKDHAGVPAIVAAMKKVAAEKWGDKAEAQYNGLKLQDKLALHDGDIKAKYQGYAGNLYINANRSADRDGPPTLFLQDGQTVGQGKDFYSGCVVNAVVDIWAQDNVHGQRINASLVGVQFFADGDRTGGGTEAATAEDFEAFAMPQKDDFAGMADDAPPPVEDDVIPF